MNFKKIIIIFFISILFVGCQTIKEKSDAIAEKENRKIWKISWKKYNRIKNKIRKSN